MQLDDQVKPTILFGIKPTHFIHLGNIFCLKQIDFNSFNVKILVADLHANVNSLRKDDLLFFSKRLIQSLLALGIKRENIILQSDYSNVYEAFFKILSW